MSPSPREDRNDQASESNRKEEMPQPRQKARRKYAPMQHIYLEQQQRQAREELGETSDEYRDTGMRDPITEMTQGEELARNNPDVVDRSPTGMGEDLPPGTAHGFGNDRDRPERTGE